MIKKGITKDISIRATTHNKNNKRQQCNSEYLIAKKKFIYVITLVKYLNVKNTTII